MFKGLIFRLERAFKRDGACFVYKCPDNQSPEQLAEELATLLKEKDIPVLFCPLNHTPGPEEHFSQARLAQQRIVLISWCFEHLDETEIIRRVDWMRARREWLSQKWLPGTILIPIVFLISQSIYEQYLCSRGGDFLDMITTYPLASELA